LGGAEGWTECRDLAALGWVGLKGRNQIGDVKDELEQSSWSACWMERGRPPATSRGGKGRERRDAAGCKGSTFPIAAGV